MQTDQRATRIELGNFRTPQMRAFHMSWIAFFFCFFAWFGIAPLMPIVREELGLTKEQVGWTMIGSVAITVLARLLIGWVCDRWGPRRTYTCLLILGSIPVMLIGCTYDFRTFLMFRLLIGGIGASFVITQYHTSLMFAPNCVGTANATTAGWGNMGGGVVQFLMPLIYAGFLVLLGGSAYWGWRLSMFVAGLSCLIVGILYYWLTQDTPTGDFREERTRRAQKSTQAAYGTFLLACRDYRTWLLCLAYALCFGVELTLKNIAALYFTDHFGLGLQAAGLAAASYGMMNLFARTLGGYISDRISVNWGLLGRSRWLFLLLVAEGIMLLGFSHASSIAWGVGMLMVVGLFVQMANGATYSIVPFMDRRCLGSVAGIVGAGGNIGAVLAGFLFQGALAWPTALALLGLAVILMSFSVLAIQSASSPLSAVHSLEPSLENGKSSTGELVANN